MNTRKKAHDATFHPEPGHIPKHVGIIPDGNRRWALERGCSLRESYSRARDILALFIGILIRAGVKEISIYLSSIQNFRRNQEDIGPLLEIICEAMDREISGVARKFDLEIVVAGSRAMYPEALLEAADRTQRQTRGNRAGRINLLIGYDPMEEVVQALTAAENPGQFYQHLLITKPVDLIVRSGDAPLLSNFLPLQSGYARLFFFDKLFNDLTGKDLQRVLEQFARLGRKFGE